MPDAHPAPLRRSHSQEEVFCHEFHLVDLRVFENCAKVVAGCDHVFSLAADMGGMGFIQSNHSVIMYNNTMISFNVMEAARQAECSRLFYASSACIYPEHIQMDTTIEGGGLEEKTAWPAQPQDAYGLEKLVSGVEIFFASFSFRIRRILIKNRLPLQP